MFENRRAEQAGFTTRHHVASFKFPIQNIFLLPSTPLVAFSQNRVRLPPIPLKVTLQSTYLDVGVREPM
jgi:hypothetical protein